MENLEDGVYCHANEPNLIKPDFIMQPNDIGYLNIHMDREVRADGLRKAYAVLRGPKDGSHAWLTWVVPPNKYDDFSEQQVLNKIHLKKFKIRQRVLKFPLRMQTQAFLGKVL